MGDYRDGSSVDDAPKANERVVANQALTDQIPAGSTGTTLEQLVINGRRGAIVRFDVRGRQQPSNYVVHPTEMRKLSSVS